MYPRDREKVKIWDVTEIINGWTPSTKILDYWDWDIARIWPNDMSKKKDYKYIIWWERYISKKWLDHSSAKLVPEWTVILSSRAPIGYVNIAKNAISTNQWCKSIICWTKLDNEFLYYFLSINKQLLENNSSWATFKELSWDSLKKIEILLPPFKVQQRIASILSKYDDLIENNNQRIKILEQEAELIYKEWFVKFKFPWHEKVRMIDSGTEFGMLPEWWEVKKVNDIVNTLQKWPSLTYVEDKEEWIPVINQKCIRNNEIEIKDIQYARPLKKEKEVCYMKKYDILVNSMWVGTLWRVSRNLSIDYNMIIHNCISFLRSKEDLLKQTILYYQIKSYENSFINLWTWSTWQTTLNINIIWDCNIIIPHIGIQEQFNKIILKMFDHIWELKKQNENLRKTRDILLPKLISGEVEV